MFDFTMMPLAARRVTDSLDHAVQRLLTITPEDIEESEREMIRLVGVPEVRSGMSLEPSVVLEI